MPLKSQEFFNSGTFVVPSGISCIQVTMIGGGGGSGSGKGIAGQFPNGSGAGGSGEKVQRFSMNVTPGQSLAITIAAGGAAALTANTVGGAGAFSQCGTFLRCLGGWGGSPWGSAAPHTGGGGAAAGANGGGINGGSGRGASAVVACGTGESPTHWGGAGGGRGGVTQDGEAGAAEPGLEGTPGGIKGGGRGGGGGGANSPWGFGSTGADSSTNAYLPPSVSYGAGAGGAGAGGFGATGAPGYCLIQWMG